ncbi:hypothetical protein PO124_25375 [Bacillus licheniformis]|nr:hypothetical protein [Bacillus licheniformis]
MGATDLCGLYGLRRNRKRRFTTFGHL